MFAEAQVTIAGSRAAIWNVVSDIENAPKIITGIQRIEVVERPARGLVGLRWRETRMLFGKPATAEKWITEAAEHEFYRTRAESDGFVHEATIRLSQAGDGVTLTSSHESRPQGFVARVMALPMFLFKGVAKRALMQDLHDIKSAVERDRATAA